MRELTDHIVNHANDLVKVTATDEPGAGGAHHCYKIAWSGAGFDQHILVPFQNGPINEAGINGVTHEALLAILIDRMASFQKGPYACRENEYARQNLEQALHWLQQRTLARMRRGVEGTHQV